jgi:hypothetical protein
VLGGDEHTNSTSRRSDRRQAWHCLGQAYEEGGVREAIGEGGIGRFKKRRLKKKQPVLCGVEIFPLRRSMSAAASGLRPARHQTDVELIELGDTSTSDANRP